MFAEEDNQNGSSLTNKYKRDEIIVKSLKGSGEKITVLERTRTN